MLATISDRKFGVSSGGSSLISYYNPHIVTAQDYYPFGMLSRADVSGSSKSYRFGFNGKMNDNDVKGGLGNQQDYGMRIYDGRVGRFLSVDPITKMYPELSPYQFSGNSPVQNIDLDGMEPLWSMNDHNQAMKEAAYAIWGPEKGERQYQISRNGQAAGAILGLIGPADIYLTKGKISYFIMGWQLGNAAMHNREKTPEGRARQEKASRAAVADVIIGFGAGYALGKGLKAGQLLYQEAKGIMKSRTIDPMIAEMGQQSNKPWPSLSKSYTIFEGQSKDIIPNTDFTGKIAIENGALEVRIDYIEKLNATKEQYTTYKSLIQKVESLAKENGVNTVKIVGYPLNKSKSEVPFIEAGYTITMERPKFEWQPLTRTKTLE